MKIKGSGKIPDYLQVRDDNFTLIAYFRADKLENGLKKFGLDNYVAEIQSVEDELMFGAMKYIQNKD
jgi:hypothetical protein